MDGVTVGSSVGQSVGRFVGQLVIQSYSHTVIRTGKVQFFNRRKSGAIIPVYKGKASTGLYVGCKVRRLRRFPINLPLASLRAYLSGKPCIRPPHAKEPLKTETTAPPPTDQKGKIRWGLRGSRWQGQPPQKGRRTARRRVFTEKIP